MRLVNALLNQVREVIQVRQIYVYTDSEIVLNWLRNPGKKEKGVFIKHRLTEIKNIYEHLKSIGLQVSFMFVPSSQNPADCATRGLHKSELDEHFWWNEPTFLHKPTSELLTLNKTSVPCFLELECCEERNEPFEIGAAATSHLLPEQQAGELISSRQATTLTKAKRILAYVLRFVRVIALRLHAKNPNNLEISISLKERLNLASTTLAGREVKYAEK
ncbi:hypothetical protein GCK32_019113, partial [Trichostrongylus colubriformis]